MLKLFEVMAWLCSTYIILLSAQYILALYYQRGPSIQTVSSSKHPFSRKSPFIFRDLNSAEEHNSSQVLFYFSNFPTFDLQKNTLSQIRKHFITPLAVYSFEPRSRLFYPTVGNLEFLSQEIQRAVSRLPHIRRGKLTKLILIATQEVSQSVLRYLATCSHSQLQLIDSVFFINPSGSFSSTKQLHIQDLMFKSKTRDMLQERSESLRQIRVVVITTDKTKEDGDIAYPYAPGTLWSDVVHLKTIDMWNIYKIFDQANKLLMYRPFLEIFAGFLSAEYVNSKNHTQIQYYFRYGQPLLNAKRQSGGQIETQRNFQSQCPSSLQISFSDKQESLMTSSKCFSITINQQESLSLLIRSGASLNVFTTSQEPIVPYYFNETFYIYFIENTSSYKTYHVSNPKQIETTISYTEVIQLLENNITGKKGANLQFAKVIKLPRIPLKVCTSQDLDLPLASKDTCFDSEGATLFRWKDVQLNFHFNKQEIYGRLFKKYEYLHGNLVFANMLAIRILNYKYAWLMCINIINLIIGCGDSAKILFILLYIFFVLSLCQLSVTLLQKLIQVRSKIRLKPISQGFILVLPLIIGMCRLIQFQLFIGSEWISLILSYFVVIGIKGDFIGFYLMYMSWDYILEGQPSYHFALLLFWMYSLYFQGDLEIYEGAHIETLTRITFFLMLFYCFEIQAIFHLLSQVYAIQLIGILLYFIVKREKMLRKIHGQLRMKELYKYKY